jgi:hypothetical protein
MARYVRDDKGFDLLAISSEVHGFAHEVGEFYADVLRSIAPVGTPPQDKHPGLYKASIETDTEIVHLPYGPRWAADIVAPVPYATVLEVGSATVPNPPRPLTRLLDIVDAADPNVVRKAARKREG